MAKIVKTVLIVAAAVAIIYFAPQLSFAASALLGGGAATTAAISAALVGAALSVGVTAFTSLFKKTPDLSQALASREGNNPDPVATRKIIFGSTAAGTDIRYKENWGNNSDRQSIVIALASHALTSVQSVVMDNLTVWQSGQGILNTVAKPGIAEIDPHLCGVAGQGRSVGSGQYWNSTSSFTGCAYSVITYICSQGLWTQGLPNKVIHNVKGCPVYDPRADSTVGGSGPMRANDQSTWAYYNNGVEIGRNPALCLLTYLIGWRINNVLAWGMALPLDAIDMASFITYANHCEEMVQTADGGQVQRYTADGIFSVSDSHQTIINSLCISMGTAILVDTNGLFALIEGIDESSTPTVHLSSADVLSSGVWTPSPPTHERVTRITGRFADPSQNFTLNSWGSIDVDPFFDGIPRTQNTDFGLVSRPESAQRIAKQLLVKSKYCGTYTAVFGRNAFFAGVGNTVTLSGPQGFNNQLFVVVSSEETFDLTYQLVLRQTSPEIWEWDKSEEKPLPTTILVDEFDPIAAESVSALAIEASSIAGTNSVTTIVIDVHWTPAGSDRTSSIEIQSQKLGDGDVWTTEAERFNPRVGEFRFGAGVEGRGVNVRARFRMDNGATGEWATTSLASTPVSNVNNYDFIYDGGTGKKGDDYAVNTRLDTAPLGSTGKTVGSVVSTVTNIQQSIINGDFATTSDVHTVLSQVNVGGNLIANSAFRTTDGWGTFAIDQTQLDFALNIAGDSWHPVNENVLSMYQHSANNIDSYWFSDFIPVEVGKWYQFSSYGASHRADIGLGIERWNAAGTGEDGGSYQATRVSRSGGANGGRDLANYDRVYFNFQAAYPIARLQLFKWATNPGNGDSYAWFCRPQLVQVAASDTPLMNYTPGSDFATINSALSRISNVETATTNLDGRFAAASRASTLEAQLAGNTGSNLLSRIQTVESVTTNNNTFASASSFNSLNAQINNGGGLAAQASSAYSASVDAQNKLSAARITFAATAGDGRAQFTLSSDGHDGRWALIGDGQISGNLTIDGTLTTSKVAGNAISNTYTGTNNGPCQYSGGYYDYDSGQYIGGGYSNCFGNDGSYGTQDTGRIIRLPFWIDVDADVIAMSKWTQGYSSGAQPFSAALYISGQQRDAISSGSAFNDNPNMMGSLRCGGGNNYVDIIWSPSAQIVASNIHLTVFVLKR